MTKTGRKLFLLGWFNMAETCQPCLWHTWLWTWKGMWPAKSSLWQSPGFPGQTLGIFQFLLNKWWLWKN